MKTKLTTILTVVMFVAVGVLNARPSATTMKGLSPAPPLSSESIMTPAAVLPQGNPNFASNRGRITRVYPGQEGVYFTFGGKAGQFQTGMNPTNGYYFIPTNHTNYSALVDLLLLAAEHDWNLQARTQPALGTGGRADVMYLVQDFSRP